MDVVQEMGRNWGEREKKRATLTEVLGTAVPLSRVEKGETRTRIRKKNDQVERGRSDTVDLLRAWIRSTPYNAAYIFSCHHYLE